MISISKTIITETAHRLLNYPGKCGHVHGHSWEWTVTVGASGFRAEALNYLGMVVDFYHLKELMVEVIGEWDHGTLLHQNDPILTHSGDVRLWWLFAPQPAEMVDGELPSPNIHRFPFNPTSENLTKHLFDRLTKAIKIRPEFEGVRIVSVSCKETCTSSCTVTGD